MGGRIYVKGNGRKNMRGGTKEERHGKRDI